MLVSKKICQYFAIITKQNKCSGGGIEIFLYSLHTGIVIKGIFFNMKIKDTF